MEESLLGQKQIRQYFKQYSEQHWNKLAKATMMIGIQSIMLANESELFWDLSKVGVDQIENLVVANELKLLEKQRNRRRHSGSGLNASYNSAQVVQQQAQAPPQYVQLRKKSNSRGTPSPPPAIQMERGIAPPSFIEQQNQIMMQVQNVAKKGKNVNFAEESGRKHMSPAERSGQFDQSSVAPQLSAGADEFNQRVNSLDKYLSFKDDAAQTMPPIEAHVQTEPNPEKQYAYLNRRHRKDFNRLKSSEAMGQILRADDNVVDRQRQIHSRLAARGQPSQKSAQRPAYHQPRPVTAQPQKAARSLSRRSSAPSHGRPSSRWRSGARSQDELHRLEQEDAQRELENKHKGMVYPSWWFGYDQIEVDNMKKKLAQDDERQQDEPAIGGTGIADPTRAKVHKTLTRYAEDSLDARLRDVRQQAMQTPAGQRVERRQQPRTAVEASMRESVQTLDGRLENLKASQASLPSEHSNYGASSQHANPLQASSSMRQLDQNHQMSRTQGSVGSFAYTSNRNMPKYSPLREPNPGHSNLPMTYSGPPNQEELQRDAKRHLSGNRNFTSELDSRFASAAQSQAPSERQRRQRKRKRADEKKRDAMAKVDARKLFKEQQAEAERNRRRVEGNPQPLRGSSESRSMNGDLEVKDGEYQEHYGAGLEKRARGGIALTVYPAADGCEYPNSRANRMSQQEIREAERRAESQKRYPFADAEPFKGNRIPSRQRSDSRRRVQEDAPPAPRRVPAQYQSVTSTIRDQINYDRRQYMEKMRVQQMKDYDEQQQMQQNQAEAAEAEQRGPSPGSRGSSGSPGKRAQIFYKREENDRRRIMEYQEGRDDDYRGSESELKKAEAIRQAQTRSTLAGTAHVATTGPGNGREQSQYQQNQGLTAVASSSDNEARYYGGEAENSSYDARNSGGELPAGKGRTISPSAAHSAMRDRHAYPQHEMTRQEQDRRHLGSSGDRFAPPSGSDQAPSSSQQPYRQQSAYTANSQYPSSYPHATDVNETGFTHKLARGAGGYNPSSISYSGDDRGRRYQGNAPPPFVGTGYYQNGRYVAQPPRGDGQYYYSSSQPEGDSSQYDAQPGVRFSGEGDNNTSRFGQRQPPQQYSSSTFQDHEQSSLQTPNVSQGGRGILKNQFDQILAMKSGEFSAGGRDGGAFPYRRGADGELLKSVGGSLGGIDEESINESRGAYGRPSNGLQQSWQGGSYQGYQNSSMYNGRSAEMRGPHHQAISAEDQRPLPSGGSHDYRRGGPSQPPSDPYRYDGGEDDRFNKNFNTSEFAKEGDDARSSDPHRARGGESSRRYGPPVDHLDRPGTGAFYQQHDGASRPHNEYKRDGSRGQANYYAGSTTLLSGAPAGTADVAGSSRHHAQNQNGTNNFTLQRPSVERTAPPPAPQSNYYVDDVSASRAGSPSRGSRESPMRREHLQGGPPTGEHMISSGTREYNRHEGQFTGNAPPPHSKYYQTFNESRGGEPPRQTTDPGATSGSHVYGSTSQARMGYGEELTSQLSPTMTSAAPGEDHPHPRAMANSHLVGGGRGDELYHGANDDARTENLRNFMEQAQPAGGLLDSQGVSQMSSHLGLSNSALRRLHMPPVTYGAGPGAIPSAHQTSSLVGPSSRTDEKEGGSVEDPASMQMTCDPARISVHQRANTGDPEALDGVEGISARQHASQNHYAGLEKAGRTAPGVVGTSSSVEHEDRMYRVPSEHEESSPDISQTEQTSHSRGGNKMAQQPHGNQRDSRRRPQTAADDDDEFSDDGEDDFISSSLAQTPAGEDAGTMTTSPLCTTGEQNTSARQRLARMNQEGQQVQQDIQKMTAQLARDVQGIGAAGQRLAGHLQDSGHQHPQMNFYRSTTEEESSKLSETPKGGTAHKNDDTESEELSPLAKSDI